MPGLSFSAPSWYIFSVNWSSHFRGLLLGFICSGLSIPVQAANDGVWEKIASTHFVVMHTGDTKLAQTISDHAETYYTDIAGDLGYTRYQKFWVWDNRVKILIYPTAEAFATACHAPAWAAGRASVERHEIASYRQSGDSFLNALLPHEMSHLILGDFIGLEHIPLWLNEGFAQWEQVRHPATPIPFPYRPVPLKTLMTMDIRQDHDRQRVALFYAQSASLVGFLINTRGGERFGAFCRGLRDGKAFEAALAAAYPDDIQTQDGLEQKWLKSLLP